MEYNGKQPRRGVYKKPKSRRQRGRVGVGPLDKPFTHLKTFARREKGELLMNFSRAVYYIIYTL